MHNNNDDQDCIRIIIADDHTIFRDGLKRLLETEPTFQVVGQAGDGHEAVQLALQVKADVLLLDVAMPKVPVLETLRELNRNQIKIRTLLLTTSIERSAGLMLLTTASSVPMGGTLNPQSLIAPQTPPRRAILLKLRPLLPAARKQLQALHPLDHSHRKHIPCILRHNVGYSQITL